MKISTYIYIIAVLSFLCLSCGGSKVGYPDYPKGYFEEWIYDKNTDYFSTDIPVVPNGLKKITEGPISYYTWKTIKSDILIDSVYNEYFTAYQTMLLSDYEKLNMEGTKYLRTANNLLNNYLFILDDRRLIYISEDGARFDNFSSGELNLLFLESAACAEEEKYATYSQAVRGYYSVDGQSMQIHFKGRKDFFVKATIASDFSSLSFDKVSIGSESTANNNDGLQNRYEDFSKIFSPIAQPIFELPSVDDLIVDRNFNLNLGVLSCDQMNDKLLSLRSEIIEKYNISNPTKYADRVVSIKYDVDFENFVFNRHYECLLQNLETFEKVSYSFTEDLTDMYSW